MYMNI